ncbi:MAG: diphthamide biosynthesis enzyme Dph2 [Thermoplasmata archaeon]|nr:diphthamide biosynthesis enzyme Dph2 [Thermoplasmata archaeon]
MKETARREHPDKERRPPGRPHKGTGPQENHPGEEGGGTPQPFPGFRISTEEIARMIGERGWKRILVQPPEGLRRGALMLCALLREKGIQADCSLDITYGACDLRPPPPGYDGILHLGHTMIPGVRFSQDTIFYPVTADIDRVEGADTAMERLPARILLVATVQYAFLLDSLALEMRRKGKEVVLPVPGVRTPLPGQILGCTFSHLKRYRDRSDAVLYVGTGRFHPLGAAVSTGLPTYALDPLSGEMTEVEAERFLRKRHALISRAAEGRTWLIAVSTKPGQMRKETAKRIAEEARRRDRKTHLLIGDTLTPDRFIGLPGDVIVSTACPRIALDDTDNYPMPVITPQEAEIALGIRRWEDYEVDGW